MPPFEVDDLERESNGSDGSSDNEQEEREDVDMDADADADADGEAEAEGDNEDENEEEDEEQELSQYSYGDSGKAGQIKPAASQASLLSNDSTTDTQGPQNAAPTSAPNPSVLLSGPSPLQSPSFLNGITWDIPKLRPEVISAETYDIIPTIAAPHSTSINAIAATPDLRWVFSGGVDGYIRKFNWIETANGKSMLTVAQRHPFVDSVTKAGVLMSYWENGEDPSANTPGATNDSANVSPVYSLACHHEGLWLLSGLESGGINLQSVRHDEGKQIACLRGHSSAVSVLNLASDEQSVLSGSWDKTVLDWDLNTGQTKRTFGGGGSQISAIETRPLSSLPVPETIEDIPTTNGTFSSDSADKPRTGGNDVNGLENGVKNDSDMNGNVGSPADSLFGGNDVDSLFGDDNVDTAPPGGTYGDDEYDDFSRAIASGIQDQDNPQDLTLGNDSTAANTAMDLDSQPLNDPPDPPLVNGETISSSALPKPPDEPSASTDTILANPPAPPHASDDPPTPPSLSTNLPSTEPPRADSIFLAATIDGSLRVWDKRQANPIAKISPKNVPPWCMNATWSPDGNYIYAGRRNGTVDEYSLHKGLKAPERNLKMPINSGAISAVRCMPNGRHLLIASFDILRLYDLHFHEKPQSKHTKVPFLIVPGHRTGVVSQLYIDPSCRYLISVAGNRGWEGTNTEVLLGYEIGVPGSSS